ncbi:MAG: transglycosylase domain-containing protein, partial [Gammaproteobacteria bacterium]|nr:transglycosylase domain-containing protein [Gammaproteobacteria bacterium]
MRWLKKLLVWTPRILLALLVFDVGYLVGIWPDWNRYNKNPVPASKFIEKYRKDKQAHPEMPALRWQPISIRNVPDHLLRAVIVSEDSRFYSHSGFDPDAFLEAMEYNLAKKRVVYGASTISQQTVKNMFLSASRDPLRKWHELVLTFF